MIGSMIHKLDLWVAKRLFFPPIVRICQLFRIDQYVFACYTSAIGMISLIYPMFYGGFWLAVVMLPIILITLLHLGITGSVKRRPSGFWRAFSVLSMFHNGLVLYVHTTKDPTSNIFMLVCWFMVLATEYALMIDRIPPLENKQETVKLSEQGA